MSTVAKRKRTNKKTKVRKVPKNGEPNVTVKETDPVEEHGAEKGFVVPQVDNRDGVPCPALTREHLLEAELMLSKINAAQVEARALHQEAQITEQNAILKVRGIRNSAVVKEKEAKELRVQINAFWTRLSEMYGINFKHAGYDDQTGLITVDPRYLKEQTEKEAAGTSQKNDPPASEGGEEKT